VPEAGGFFPLALKDSPVSRKCLALVALVLWYPSSDLLGPYIRTASASAQYLAETGPYSVIFRPFRKILPSFVKCYTSAHWASDPSATPDRAMG